jgi:broad specificity phosphatase PhoE
MEKLLSWGCFVLSRIILVRHGETIWNKEKVFRGKHDLPLNEKGLKQAERVAVFLRKFNISAIYSSPLQRALQSAAFLAAEKGLEINPLEAFSDLSFGIWEGKSLEEVRGTFPLEIQAWEKWPHLWSVEGGESLERARKRAFDALLSLVEKHRKEVFAVFTHRVILKLLLLGCLEMPNSRFWSIYQDTCAINILQYQPETGFVLILLNETCHLRGLGTESDGIDF